MRGDNGTDRHRNIGNRSTFRPIAWHAGCTDGGGKRKGRRNDQEGFGPAAVDGGIGCGGAVAGRRADKVKLKMAEVVRSQFYIPMYVALSKGFVGDEGLEVELITANGGDRAGALLLSGQTEFALAGPEVPVYIYNGESPDKPVIFCALTATDGLFLASRQKLDMFDWSMLNGKKIMGWRPGSTPELYLEYV